MPFALFDDRYDDHRKVKRAWRTHPAAVGLHAMAVTYCNRHNTDGLLDAEWVHEKLTLSPLNAKQQKAALEALVDAGLFERAGDDYVVHDYLEWNRSRAQREELAERGRRGGQAKATATAKPPDGPGSSPGQAAAKPSSSGGSSDVRLASPTPRFDPDLLLREIQESGQGLAQPEQIDRLCELLASHVHRNDPKADPNPASDRWQTDMRLLLVDRKGEVGEVARIIDWCQRDEFWRSNILSPGKLRKQFTQLLLRAGKTSGHGSTVLPFGRRAEVIQAANAWQNAPEYRGNGA